MRRNIALAVVQLFVVVQILLSSGVADAQMKVACIGDSITALPTGWCGYLGTKLGSGYTAKTFGVSATTLLKNVGQPAYSSSAQYKPSHDYAPNIVVIMLGTNDSMPRNWNAGKDHFVKDYEELIDSYTSLASKPTVFLNTAPPASNNNMFTISGMTIEKEINPLIKQVAMNKMCPLVDVWAALGGDPSKLGGSDGVHPGASGSMLIADAVAKAIIMPMIPGGGAGMGASAGAGGGAAGSANTSGAGGSANISGAGGSANASGAGGSANTGGAAGGSANISGAGAPGRAGSGANTAGSMNTSGTASLAGAGGGANAAGNTGTMANPIGAAGTSAPIVTAAEGGDGGCRAAGSSASSSGATALALLLLGMALRTRKLRAARFPRG